MQFYDNSRLGEFKTCPRKFYFRYILDLVPDRSKLAFDFGSSWHEAMDALWGAVCWQREEKTEATHVAIETFKSKWAELGHPRELAINQEELYMPRTPSIAAMMLESYADRYYDFLKSIELEKIEEPFAVPLDPDQTDLFYVGRIDKRFRQNGRPIFGEHKTSTMYSTKEGIQPNVTEAFRNDAQIDGYNYKNFQENGHRNGGVMVDLALVHKQHHTIFKREWIDKDEPNIRAWLQDTLYWVDQVETAKREHFFPKRAPTGCRTVYGRCKYWSICPFYDSATVDEEEIPSGFRREKWEPFDFSELEEAIKGN